MANEHGLFWNSQNGDRVYDANDFSEWLKKFYTTGVFNGDLEVTAAGGMTVSVSSGYVNIEGKVKFFSTPTTLTLATASGTYGRIDTVVAECNYTDREIKLKVVTGTYSTSPTATAPVRTAAAYQLVLAQIDVAAGATEITQKNITDKRMDSNVCGLVTGTVSQIDFSTVKAQFDSWFDDVKGTLDTDAAGNLKNQIDDINDKLGSTDISSIGDGTETSAIAKNASDISTLNNGLANIAETWYPKEFPSGFNSTDRQSMFSLKNGLYYHTPFDGTLNFPSEWGFMIKIGFKANEEYSDFNAVYFTQASGSVYRCSGNLNRISGWVQV